MACQNKLQRIEANEKTREKELLERTCTYKSTLCSSECICGMSISDFKDVPNTKKFKKYKKKVHFAGSNPADTQHHKVQQSFNLNRSNTCQPCLQSGADKVSKSQPSNDAEDISKHQRGRQHLDFLTGATRHKRSRSISPTRRTATSDSSENGHKTVNSACDNSTSSSEVRDNLDDSSSKGRRRNHPGRDVTSTTNEPYRRSEHSLKLVECMRGAGCHAHATKYCKYAVKVDVTLVWCRRNTNLFKSRSLQ